MLQKFSERHFNSVLFYGAIAISALVGTALYSALSTVLWGSQWGGHVRIAMTALVCLLSGQQAQAQDLTDLAGRPDILMQRAYVSA